MSDNNSSKSKDSPDDSVLSKIPSELRLTYKWDGCVERALAHTSVGTIVGGLASVVLFSKFFSLSLSLSLCLSSLCMCTNDDSKMA